MASSAGACATGGSMKRLASLAVLFTAAVQVPALPPQATFRAGVDLVLVPAKSGPQAVSDLMSGQVDFYFGNAS